MHKGKSMFLTILCMGVILGFGYLLIMESGQKVLENGIMLEETDYESTSSNIFYGKIEEDIEVFPWNYYPGDEAGLGWKTESGIHPMFQYSMLSDDDDSVEEELKSLQSWYLCQMIAYKTNSTPSEVWSIFEKKQHTIMDEICMVENSPVGALFFYEDMLSIKGKRYQVRVSFTQWNIINFVCMEEREQDDSGRQGSSGTQASVKKRMALGSQKAPKVRTAKAFRLAPGARQSGRKEKRAWQRFWGSQKSRWKNILRICLSCVIGMIPSFMWEIWNHTPTVTWKASNGWIKSRGGKRRKTRDWLIF